MAVNGDDLLKAIIAMLDMATAVAKNTQKLIAILKKKRRQLS